MNIRSVVSSVSRIVAVFGALMLAPAAVSLLFGESDWTAFLISSIVTAAVGVAGITVAHFWTGLILLGLGWNFGFIGGTTLLTTTYEPAERNKAQGLNDFLVFFILYKQRHVFRNSRLCCIIPMI